MASAAQFGFILENIGGGEIVVIAFLALVVLGPDRIPEMARGAGRMLHNLRKLTSEWTGDMQDIVNDPAMQPIRELGEFAVRPRQKLAQYALEAEAEERSKAASADPDAASDVESPSAADADEAHPPVDRSPEPADRATDVGAPAAGGADTPAHVEESDPAPSTQIADEER
jgi:sec-independent protein translocase protein TatB